MVEDVNFVHHNPLIDLLTINCSRINLLRLIHPWSISSAIFSASIYTVLHNGISFKTKTNKHTTKTHLCGCPGGKNGNALASTTRNPRTPKTLARLSTTAIGSPALPILHVAAA